MTKRRFKPNRGSALVITILVVLVLTVVGLGVAYFMQVEDRLSGNGRTLKTGFYAAEAGLKTGEKWINAGFQTAGSYLYLGKLVPTYTPADLTPPGGGNGAYYLILPNATDIGFTGSFKDVPVSAADSSLGSFTLYVRHDAYADPATTVNLISVGKGPGGILRILEEQLSVPGLSTSGGPTQAGGTPGGAGSVLAGSS